VTDPLHDVLQKVFTRPDDIFFDDILLVDEQGGFLGLIFARTLVRLQHSLLRQNISTLETKQKELNGKNEEMMNDLRMAGEIQQTLLPNQNLSFQSVPDGNHTSLRFYHRYEPSGGVSGDLFHVFPIDGNKVGVFICDVMGHGVRSAFVTAMLRTLVQELGHLSANPGELLTRINCELKAILKQTGDLIYATAFYLIYDIQSGKIRYARASHPKPLWLQRKTGTLRSLNCPADFCGPALGFFENSQYETIEDTIPAGDAIFFVTDGLFELFDAQGNEFGEKRLAEEIQKNRHLQLQPLMDKVYAEALNFTEARKFDDDVCFLGMETA
jgi:serine phosphatase RsbU (regulator of sigma subunit)